MAKIEDLATPEWLERLKKESPELLGLLHRDPTEDEIRLWLEQAEENRNDLILFKLRYHRSGLRKHMLQYLELRMSCGYIEKVPIPGWLLLAGKS